MSQKREVLILCTGNSCRSVMAEALVNTTMGDCVHAQSSGVKASGKAVDEYAKTLGLIEAELLPIIKKELC